VVAHRLFVFGGHVGRYAGRDDGAVRTNQLLVLHSAHTLGADEASGDGTSPAWEKGTPSSPPLQPSIAEPLTLLCVACRVLRVCVCVCVRVCVTVSLGKVKGRAGHASFVRNGKLYIHGGYDTGHRVLSDLIEIDPSSSTCGRTRHSHDTIDKHRTTA
jgi:hypothetical protein